MDRRNHRSQIVLFGVAFFLLQPWSAAYAHSASPQIAPVIAGDAPAGGTASGEESLPHLHGRLGCIQPIDAAPGAYTATSSYVYGVGAFLLAGSEIYRLSR